MPTEPSIQEKVSLPFEGSNPPAPHISVEVLDAALQQLVGEINKTNTQRQQTQQLFNDIQQKLSAVQVRAAQLDAQRVMVTEIRAKIVNLLAPPNAPTPTA